MSQRANRHQRRPSQCVFVIPDNLTAPMPDEIAPPPPAAQPPHPTPEKNGGGVHLLPKPAEKMPASDRSSRG
ncbi:hypothetical protein AAHA92_25488 [Salvia divinorum]|uniref:Uncharacterized protein n=1 Tax=Salvia divinorum TaxID=28513 RepID=A0ABD1GDG0_SALDI